MAFDDITHYLALGLALFAAFALGRKEQIRPLWVLLLFWAAVSAFRAERDIWLLAVVAVAAIASSVSPSAQSTGLARPSKIVAIACVLVVNILGFGWLTPSNKELLSSVAHLYPVGSVAYIHEHKLTGPIFNDFNWGGFLIYALPEIPVAIDGRTNVHGQNEIAYSEATWNLKPGWHMNPQLSEAKLIIANPNTALAQVLYRDTRFKAPFTDGVSVLFVRTDTAAQK